MNAISKVLVDIVDDLKCITFTAKAWNYIGLTLVILAGWYWGACSQYGDFFKVTGCILYCAAAYNWVSKSAWGQWCANNLFNEE